MSQCPSLGTLNKHTGYALRHMPALTPCLKRCDLEHLPGPPYSEVIIVLRVALLRFEDTSNVRHMHSWQEEADSDSATSGLVLDVTTARRE